MPLHQERDFMRLHMMSAKRDQRTRGLLFDHLIGAGEERPRYLDAECFRGHPLRLLSAGGGRPSECSSAENGEELAPLHRGPP